MIEAILNRLRGTGDIFNFLKLRVTGTMVYTVHFVTVISILSTWYYGVLAGILFLIGESFAWGTWVSYLCYPDGHAKEYDSKVGRSFPFIHYCANAIVSQYKNYKLYCQVALTIRGFWWWSPLYILLGYIDVANWYSVSIAIMLLSIGFPIACWLGYKTKLFYKSKYLSVDGAWERQEIWYGLIQGLVFWSIILVSSC